MRVFIVDDEIPCIDELAYLLRKYPDLEIAATFTGSRQALEAIVDMKPDAVFLDIDMPHQNGLELALSMQEHCPDVVVIFITAYARYALEAFQVYPLDFLLKPVQELRLDKTVEHLRRQYALLHPPAAGGGQLRIKCFGHFVLQSDRLGEIKWGTRRVKELLLYLINRNGAAAGRYEITRALFDGQNDKKTANNLYVTIFKLRSLLHALDDVGRYIKMTADHGLQITPGVCDYIDFIRYARQNAVISKKNAAEAVRVLNLCTGLYLEHENYEWAAESAHEVEYEYERIALGLAAYYAATERLCEAEGVLDALLLRNPWSEEGRTMLLDLHMQQGDAKAFAAGYREYVRVLKKELGAKPREVYRKHYNTLKK